MHRKYHGIARFIIIMIAEAHASDEWPVGKSVSFCKQHKTMDERLKICNEFAREFRHVDPKYKNRTVEDPENLILTVPIWVDDMTNGFMNTFASWPFRYFVIQNGRLKFKAQPNLKTSGYDLKDILPFIYSH